MPEVGNEALDVGVRTEAFVNDVGCLEASEVLGVFAHELFDGVVAVLAFVGDFLLAPQ